MDSTQIASNIVSASRLQLLVEGLQRVERILSDADKARLTETLAPYTKDSAGHYTYRVKGKEAVQEHLQKIGQTIHTLLQDLKTAYADQKPYQVLERLFSENFHPSTGSGQALVESGPRPKENTEITSGCLQSVDDLEATYRTKGTGHYKGYVANITETCDPENELQLITKVQVAPNNVDDTQLLAEALPNLKERTGVKTMITDGGFGGAASDTALKEQNVNLIQTAIRGSQPNPDKLHLSDFDLPTDELGRPTTLTCPLGQTVPVTPARTSGWQARFDPAICATCPFQTDGRCRTKPQKRDPHYLLAFTPQDVLIAKRRKEYLAHQSDGHNLRSAVESSVRSVKHPFPAGQLPVRSQFRVACTMIASAATTNVRRIQRYLAGRTAQSKPTQSNLSTDATLDAFFAFVWAFVTLWLKPRLAPTSVFGC
jgi:hypothetical protein